MLSPRWQHDPLSGAGAARNGGRWNRIGLPALYLSLDHPTAIAEYHQTVVRPGTLAAYDVKSGSIADFRDTEVLNLLRVRPAALIDEWATIVDVREGEPATWPLADRLIEAGAHGAVVPSAQNPGGTNLVLWRWSEDGRESARVRVVDPEGDLRRS